jgi:quercetin dioxygenase-like cupin family protein
MKIINVENIEKKEVSNDPLFVGGKVTTQFVLDKEHKAQKLQIVLVRFAAGARNKLHTHSTEQILVVTEGKGIIATKDQEHI